MKYNVVTKFGKKCSSLKTSTAEKDENKNNNW